MVHGLRGEVLVRGVEGGGGGGEGGGGRGGEHWVGGGDGMSVVIQEVLQLRAREVAHLVLLLEKYYVVSVEDQTKSSWLISFNIEKDKS